MPLSPLSAKVEVGPGDRLSAYVEARTADAVGDQLRAARLFATLASAEPTNTAMARRAVAAAINAGDTALALSVARSAPAAAIGLDGRLLLVADALRRDKADEALALVEGKVDDNEGGFVAPLMRAWVEQKAGRDGATRLAGLGSDTLLGPFALEQRAAMLLATRKVDQAMALVPKVLASAGGRETRLRLAYAAMLARAGKADQARALLADGNDPALKRLDLRRPQPVEGRRRARRIDARVGEGIARA